MLSRLCRDAEKRAGWLYRMTLHKIMVREEAESEPLPGEIFAGGVRPASRGAGAQLDYLVVTHFLSAFDHSYW